MNKIEQLIEKWKLKQEDLHNVGYPIDGYYIYVAEIIKDLQSLKDTTEEREVEIDRNDSIINMKYKTTC